MIYDDEAIPAEEKESWPEPAPRRRLRIYVSGYSVQRALMVSVTGCALFGAALGDIWLWRLLYGA